MKEFITKNKEKIIKILLSVLVLFIISILVSLLLWGLNILYFDEGIRFNIELFNYFKHTWYGYIFYILFQCVITTLLCVMPGTNMAFILLSLAIYDTSWQAFMLSFVGVISSSFFMYIIGRLFGYKLCTKLLGEEDWNKATILLRNKGSIYFPVMMLFPFFPDDALVMVAGTTKMSLKWVAPSVIIGRGIGVALIVFGISIVPFKDFTTIYDWIVFVTIFLFWTFIIFYSAYRLNKYLESKKNS